MFKFMNDKIVSCLTMGKAHFTHACGGLPKCGAKLGYHLGNAPTLGLYLIDNHTLMGVINLLFDKKF
jgi:hypothetical protein